jgi:hypothetical protein
MTLLNLNKLLLFHYKLWESRVDFILKYRQKVLKEYEHHHQKDFLSEFEIPRL